MNEGTCLVAEVEPERIEKRLDDALPATCASPTTSTPRSTRRSTWKDAGTAKSIGVRRERRATCWHRLIERDIVPEILTDQTSAHDPLERLRPRTG